MFRQCIASLAGWAAFSLTLIGSATAQAARIGDLNCDGAVNNYDIDAFTLALTNSNAYLTAYPNCDISNADTNGDGALNNFDIDPFVVLLTSTGAGIDVQIVDRCLVITRTDDPMNLALRLRAGAPNQLELDLRDDRIPEYRFDRSLFECINVNAGGGDDIVRVDEVNGVFTDTEITTINGGPGNDTLIGGSGAETFIGGTGADTVFMGGGDDIFIWIPGDGSDLVEGGAGQDTMLFNGSNASENVNVTANGGRVLFTRDVGNITMDLNGVETVEFHALGGADNITVGDTSGTDLTSVELDLRGSGGGGDGAADTVTVNGTQGSDTLGASGNADGITVFGLHTTVDISSAEPANDRLTLNALGGDDVVNAQNLEAGAIQLTINGGAGNDLLIGSQGDDTIIGGVGADTALMGAGDDTFIWNPGDGSDIVEGQGGHDTMLFNGANIAEVINVSANGGRLLFTRNVGTIVMDCNGVEEVDFTARGGADQITINDLSGTDVTSVQLDLAEPPGSGTGDGAADTITVNATSGDDVITVSGDAAGVSVLGLAAQVLITGCEAALDRLIINALAGDDVVDASGLQAGALSLTADGGDDDDVLVGSDGDDILRGGIGDDVLIGGPGSDTLDGGPGNNTVIQ